MAINIDTQDIDQYPGTIKRVTVDQDTLVPTGYEGDEQFVIKVSTSAYSDNATNTTIPALYVTDFDIGWAKSSGLAGTGGKFALDATHKDFKIKMDNTVSGTDGMGYYTISLAYDTGGISLSGEVVAEDMEAKIRALTMETADTGYQSAYINASVEFRDGKFWISSGTIGRYYTGEYKSSVDIAPAASNDATTLLGFNIPITSETLANTTIAEALIVSDYGANTTPLAVAPGTGVSVGASVLITNGADYDYFTALSGTTSTSIVVPTTGNNNFTGISNDYTTASGTKVQVLKEQDPDNAPVAWCSSVDSIIRYGLKNIINVIDYSS